MQASLLLLSLLRTLSQYVIDRARRSLKDRFLVVAPGGVEPPEACELVPQQHVPLGKVQDRLPLLSLNRILYVVNVLIVN